MNKLFFVHHCFRLQANAGAKPSIDFEDVLTKMGAKAIGLPRAFFKYDKAVHLRDILNSLIIKAIMPKNSTIVLQYPAQYNIAALARQAKNRGNRLIIMVHDINTLRGRAEADFPEVLRAADVIIAHTPAMQKWLQEQFPQAEVIVLGIFDYLLPQAPAAEAPETTSVVFAGNLAKSTFLQNLNFPDNLKLVLFGVGIPEALKQLPFVDYRGSCMPHEIPERIAGETFGLVWDGDSTASCSGSMGEYLRFNAPYKLSSYIAAGIPVIIWDKMGIADFVKQNGIGIAIDNLANIPDAIAAIAPDHYKKMRQNARNLQAKITQGQQAATALNTAINNR